MLEELTTQFFSTDRGQKIGLGISIFLSLLLVAEIGNMFQTWHSDYILTHKKSFSTLSSPLVSSEAAQLIAQIPAMHLFGWHSEEASYLPITSLQLHLTGIVKMQTNSFSKAMISEAGQLAKVYAVGDVLTSGIKIYAVNDDGIVLEHNGRLEKLPLARSVLSFQDLPAPLLQVE